MRTPLRAVATTGVVALVALLSACTPTPPPPADPSVCPPRDPGEIRVAVVVDAAELGDVDPSVVCVVLPSGSDGLDALAARAQRLGTAAPRLGGSGLVCGIDGAPAAPACGESGPNGYRFWGYFIGDGGWSFAPVGPGGRALSDGDVDGWKFQDGSSGPPPTSASFTELTG